jgi:hypothetical protein
MSEIPPDLDKELEEIYKSSPTYFKAEHIETLTHKEYVKKWWADKKEKERLEKEEKDIKVIMRQTNYSREQALESLHKNISVEKCIEEYLGITKKNNPTPMSTNQAIYRSLREWLN